jgi:hypothetical protein
MLKYFPRILWIRRKKIKIHFKKISWELQVKGQFFEKIEWGEGMDSLKILFFGYR